MVEQEAREQGSLSRGEGTERDSTPTVAPNPAGYENHLTEVGDSDPCSAPLHGSWKGSFPSAKSPLPPASSLMPHALVGGIFYLEVPNAKLIIYGSSRDC
jgi:hypothetical protein